MLAPGPTAVHVSREVWGARGGRQTDRQIIAVGSAEEGRGRVPQTELPVLQSNRGNRVGRLCGTSRIVVHHIHVSAFEALVKNEK